MTMIPLTQRAMAAAYIKNDGQLTGAELKTLASRTTGRQSDAMVSALVREFANPQDRQVIAMVRGQIPGADTLLTATDKAGLRQRVDLANDAQYQARFDAGIARATGVASTGGNQPTLHVDGNEAFPEIYRLIRNAEHTIDMDYYMFETNSTGEKVSQELIAAAKRGVRVNVMVDALMAPLSRKTLDAMKAAGINVRPFTNGFKVPILHPSDSANHRKLLLVDGKAGMVGGMNIGESYEKYWHDSMTSVQGPAVKDLYKAFTRNWVQSGGKEPTDALALAAKAAVPMGDAKVAVHLSTPKEHQIAQGFQAAIDQAKDHIYMSSPYFIDQPLVDHLKAAAKRGVKVVVVVPMMTDIFIVNWVNKARVNEMLAAGVTVRTFDTTPKAERDKVKGFSHAYFAHAKLLTVDGVWSGVGSANASARSMWHNQEVNVGVTSPAFAQDIEQRFFHTDIANGRVHAGAISKDIMSQGLIRATLMKHSQLIPM
jgi:cardiolipin synthase